MPTLRGSGEHQAPEPRFLTVAQLGKAWGLRGELKVLAQPAQLDELARQEVVYLGQTAAPYHVCRLRRYRQDWLLSLHGCDDRNLAEALQGQVVRIRVEDAQPLQADEYYCHQIIGLQVVTLEGERLGEVVEVLETGANDVYVVDGPRGEVLLPARAEVVRQVDLEHGLMHVTLLPGLLPSSSNSLHKGEE